MNPESRIEQAFCRWCASKSIPCLKVQAIGVRGFPDRLILLQGKVVFIEFKTPTGVLSEHQIRCHNRLKALGLDIHVCRSKEEAINVIENIARLPETRR